MTKKQKEKAQKIQKFKISYALKMKSFDISI